MTEKTTFSLVKRTGQTRKKKRKKVYLIKKETYQSRLVIAWSTTVPGAGFSKPEPAFRKILVLIRFCTTTYVSIGLYVLSMFEKLTFI